MLRLLPFLPYCGLTIILGKPSRIDLTSNSLLSGHPGTVFDKALSPFTKYHCDIRLVGEQAPLLPNTKVVLLLGDFAKGQLNLKNITLNECRGNTYHRAGITWLCSYDLQEAFDRRNYQVSEEEDSDELPDEGTGKDHSQTQRKNFKYWLLNDIKKAVDILLHGYHPQLDIVYRTYPNLEEVIQLCNATTDAYVPFDIETNSRFKITVLSLAVDNHTVFTIPIYRYTGELAYDQTRLCRFFASLDKLFSRNTIIIHNGAFDLFILAWRYRIIPPKKLWDSMVVEHRLSPETEKSLGHVISLRCHEEFHKNEGVFEPKSREQEIDLWKYNAKDVARLITIHQSQVKAVAEAKLETSINRANKLVGHYLLQAMQGIKLDKDFLVSKLTEQQALKQQYLRIISILTGYHWDVASWQRIAKYLYEYKSYPKPPPTYVDGKIKYEELTSAATLYKLALKFNIPFLRFLFAFRHATKKAGFLQLDAWTNINSQFTNTALRDRFTSQTKVTGTDTFRTASSKLFGRKGKYPGTKDFNGWGSNAQNIEKELRKILVADGNEIY